MIQKNTRRRNKWIVSGMSLFVVIAMVVVIALALFNPTGDALAHGGMISPPTRTYICYKEGPENPQSDVCKNAIAQGGTQPLYDWFEINLLEVNGRHRQIIPDGKLCGAGREKYDAYNGPTLDWPAADLPSGASHTFQYEARVAHKGKFELYVTRDSYNPATPLKWSDLETDPFSVVTDPPIIGGFYQWDATLPAGKTGRHIIYTIWQRSDSPEAFYNCSDVNFGGSNGPPSGPVKSSQMPDPSPSAVTIPTPDTSLEVVPEGDPNCFNTGMDSSNPAFLHPWFQTCNWTAASVTLRYILPGQAQEVQAIYNAEGDRWGADIAPMQSGQFLLYSFSYSYNQNPSSTIWYVWAQP